LCGAIESITVRPKPNAEDGTLEAIVFFESSGAADTAVLLTNAILVDRNISITYFKGTDAKEATAQDAATAAAASAEGGNGEEKSVWASILAAGYMLGENISNAASEVDQKYGVTKGFVETVDKIDQTLGLTTKAAAIGEAVRQKSEELHMHEKLDAMGNKMTEAGQSISRGAASMYDSAMQNEYVSSALNTLSGWGSAIVSGWMSLTDEANAIYGKMSDAVNGEAAAPAAAAAETPSGDDADTVTVPKDSSLSEPADAPKEEAKDAAAGAEAN